MTLSGSILIIDDEANLRQTLVRVLKQAGCEVTAAADGLEALRLLGSTSYDLVYLDIHLPGMDGLQVLQEIHRQPLHPPVILFTAHASLQSALQAMRLGAIDYLIKPIDPETLIARTRVVLGEQAIERRRREIQEQITALQTELQSLDNVNTLAAPLPPTLTSPTGDRFLKRGTLILDLQARRATFGDKVLSLPPAAFDYLLVLARHSPDTVSYQTLVAEAQGYQTDRQQAQELAKWHIHELRDSIEPDPKHPRHVLNIRGTGYRLILD
ncbi:MAG: response regulator transcription factor [Chloroflexi bacterium]|nr:response regulator transcription factor [Chloroflexota bacterium]